MALPQYNVSGAAGVARLIYTVPGTAGQSDARTAAISINVCALLACTATIWVAPPTGSLTDGMKIENVRPLQATDVIERTQIVLPAGWRVFVASSVDSGLACQVWGIEETV